VCAESVCINRKLPTIMNLLKTQWIGEVSFVHMLPVSSRCQSDRCEVMINTTASQKLQLPLTLPTPELMTDFCTLVSLFRIFYVNLQVLQFLGCGFITSESFFFTSVSFPPPP